MPHVGREGRSPRSPAHHDEVCDNGAGGAGWLVQGRKLWSMASHANLLQWTSKHWTPQTEEQTIRQYFAPPRAFPEDICPVPRESLVPKQQYVPTHSQESGLGQGWCLCSYTVHRWHTARGVVVGSHKGYRKTNAKRHRKSKKVIPRPQERDLG